jgi:hypothetical protein
VALVIQAHPEWTNRMVREALMKTASTAESPNLRLGWGIVNALAAINYKFPNQKGKKQKIMRVSMPVLMEEITFVITTTDCIQVNCVCDDRHYNLMCDAARCE